MTRNRPWEAAYPAALRDYVLDLSDLPLHPAGLAAEAAKAFASDPAFTVVLPSGLKATLDFNEIDVLTDALAAFLQHDLQLAPGDVVAVQLPNSLHYPLAVFGAWKAGLIVTTVNPLYTTPEVERQLRDSGAKALIVSDLFLNASADAAAARGVHLIVASLWDFFAPPIATAIRTQMEKDYGDRLKPAGPHTRFIDAVASTGRAVRLIGGRDDIVLYQYTGGTTGESKAAEISGANVLSALRMTSDFLEGHGGAVAGGTTLTVLPLYHIFAFVLGFLMHFRAGSHNVLVPSPRPLTNLKPAFDAFPIDWMAGVDTLYAGLLAEPWFRETPPRLRFALTGGTAIRPATARGWEETVGVMIEGYGLTESTCIVSANPPTDERRIGSVGLPLPGCDVKIVDDQGVERPVGQAGELWVRGPQIIKTYRGATDDGRAAFTDDWFRTGDIAEIDTTGHLRIVDRKKDMILVSGFNVYPNEVEDVIAAHPEVLEVAVIGVADEKTGEAVRAFVVPRGPGLTAAAVIDHCRANLAAYKAPKDIVFRDALPKSPVGKILRARLRNETLLEPG